MDANALKAKGNSEFTAGKYSEAVETFTQAIALDADNHVLYSNRSGAYAALGKFEDAKKDAESCVAKKSDWFKGFSRLGAALHGLKKYDEAMTQYEKAKSLAPDASNQATIQGNIDELKNAQQQDAAAASRGASSSNPFAKMFGPDCLAKIASNPRLQPLLVKPGYVDKIKLLQQQPQLIQGLMQDQDIMTTFIELMGLQGQFKAGAGAGGDDSALGGDEDDESPNEHPQARREREPATASRQQPAKPPSSSTHASSSPSSSSSSSKPAAKAAAALTPAQQAKEEGNKLYVARKFDEALAKYDEAFQLDPKNTTYLLNRTAVLFEQAKYDEVIEESDKALEHLQEHKADDYVTKAKIMTRKASALQKLNKHDEALALFQTALVENRNAETLQKFEACKTEKKRLDEEAYLSPELSLKAKEEGNAHYKENRFPEAVKCYDEAIKRNPKDHVLYSNRAGALIKLTAFDDAVKDCDRCLELCPTFIRAFVRKGQAYFMTKQYYRALQMYDEGLKIDGAHEECIEGRMRVLAKIQEVSHSDGDADVAQRAMMDPEIQGIMNDSYMQMVLGEVQRDPKRLNDYMRDPRISANINKLVAAGIIRMGSGAASSGASSNGGGARRH